MKGPGPSIAIRVGVEGGRIPVLERARTMGAPILVSANSLWDNKRQRFGRYKGYAGFDVALDSGGFEAMRRYGGYRWSAVQYLALAKLMQPTWYAQMDFCCEPELAANQAAVYARIDRTVAGLVECQEIAERLGMPRPMPVLQGWSPDDYCQGPIYDPSFVWPALVGIGSVCRRDVHGPTGILAVISALHARVPEHVRFHLFGVKSAVLKCLVDQFPNRIQSIDSMAWSYRARRIAQERNVSCNGELRAEVMGAWYERQLRTLA
jgi:hypothetical protein